MSKKNRKDMSAEELELVRKEDRERRQKSRQKDREEKLSALPPESKKKKIEDLWQKNRGALSAEERKKLDDHVADWVYIVGLCRDDSRRIRDKQEYGSTDDEKVWPPFCPEQDFAEIEAFAKKFPPTKDWESYHTFFDDPEFERRIENEPFYFRTYGYGVDSIDTTAYNDFLYCFGDWYTENRNKLTLATTTEYGPEYAKTWEEIDALVDANKKLSWRCSRAMCQRERLQNNI